jgi:hypothetical protein
MPNRPPESTTAPEACDWIGSVADSQAVDVDLLEARDLAAASGLAEPETFPAETPAGDVDRIRCSDYRRHQTAFHRYIAGRWLCLACPQPDDDR